jgi:4-methylaminobutanoate oxidase (formaldehyde-forming)
VHPTPDFGRQASHALIEREHRAVREAVGVLDMSLMAKLTVQGPHAATVLSRLSANDVDREVGRVVYTQWLHAGGGIVADVTVTRTGEQSFLVVASDITHRAIEARIRRECRADEVVVVTDTTSATTLLSLQGPFSRTLLARLSDTDLSNEAFPYLTAQRIHVGYAPVWAVRVTYVGELGWELHVPTEYAAGVWDDLMAYGAEFGIRPVGLGAMASLRLEKGYRDMGVDIDTTDTPLAAGLGFAVAWDKPGGFVGREALVAARALGAPRQRVVSLFVDDPSVDLFGNEPVLCDGKWTGYVRAAAFGHTLGGPVALVQVSSDEGVTGDWLRAHHFEVSTPSGVFPAQVQIGPFLDPERVRILAGD